MSWPGNTANFFILFQYRRKNMFWVPNSCLPHKLLKHNQLMCWKLSVYRLGFRGFNLAVYFWVCLGMSHFTLGLIHSCGAVSKTSSFSRGEWTCLTFIKFALKEGSWSTRLLFFICEQARLNFLYHCDSDQFGGLSAISLLTWFRDQDLCISRQF